MSSCELSPPDTTCIYNEGHEYGYGVGIHVLGVAHILDILDSLRLSDSIRDVGSRTTLCVICLHIIIWQGHEKECQNLLVEPSPC